MKITLLSIGKTQDNFIREGIEKYVNRLKHYVKFQIVEIPELKDTKNLSEAQQKSKEAELLLKHIQTHDFIILLDENGKDYSSVAFATYLQKKMISGGNHAVFIIGGPYGFDQSVYDAAKERIALSKMTFSHQMVRFFFVEQLYRAFTIIKGEPYHHQ